MQKYLLSSGIFLSTVTITLPLIAELCLIIKTLPGQCGQGLIQFTMCSIVRQDSFRK